MKTSHTENNKEDESKKKETAPNEFQQFCWAVWKNIKVRIRKIDFWIETVAVIGGLFYAVITWRMWRDSHNNFQADERAWLNVTTRVMDVGTIKVDIPINGRAILSVTGKTPAKQIFSEFQIELLENSEAPSLSYDKSSIRHLIGYLPPAPISDAISINVFRGDKVPTETLSEKQAKALLEGRAYLSIFGHGQYRDSFGNEHWFHFCGYNAYVQTPKGQNALSCVEYTDSGNGRLPEGRLTK